MYFDAAKEIAELKAKLAQPNLSEIERAAFLKQITMWGGRLPPPVVKWDSERRWDAFESGFWNAGGAAVVGTTGSVIAFCIGIPWGQAKIAGFAVGALKFFFGSEPSQK